MKIGARQRWIVLVALLTLALTAAAWVRESDKAGDAGVVEAPTRSARSARPVANTTTAQRSGPERVALDRLQSHRLELNNTDPFEPRSWKVLEKPRRAGTAAVAVVAAPPPPPTAPPLPFIYLGRLNSEEGEAVFLTLGERNLVVHAGDTIDSLYRVDALAETQVTLTHLPTGIRQTLAIEAAQ